MPNFPYYFKIESFKPPNDSIWEFGDKIEVIFDKPIFYYYKCKRDKFVFIREDVFFKQISIDNKNRKISENTADLYRQLDEYKLKNGCSICGYKKNARAIHFDHLLPENKKHNVSYLANRFARAGKNKQLILRKLIEEEVQKCILLCANCHCEKTAQNKCGQDKLKTTYSSISDYMIQNGKSDAICLTIHDKILE